jgi:adenosylmethionine-8-amino-7-oxononanoate aminotransferase
MEINSKMEHMGVEPTILSAEKGIGAYYLPLG